MVTSDDLVTLARSYASAANVPLSTVSSRVFDDGKKLSALENGGDIYSRRLARSVQWFSDNWPAAAVWPDGVMRPEPTKTAAETGAAA